MTMPGAAISPGRRSKSRTGYFASRLELTAHVWTMHRLQVVPNLAAIARACGVGVSTVATVIGSGEGRDDYLVRGCPAGA